jgi:hypothetical protein
LDQFFAKIKTEFQAIMTTPIRRRLQLSNLSDSSMDTSASSGKIPSVTPYGIHTLVTLSSFVRCRVKLSRARAVFESGANILTTQRRCQEPRDI